MTHASNTLALGLRLETPGKSVATFTHAVFRHVCWPAHTSQVLLKKEVLIVQEGGSGALTDRPLVIRVRSIALLTDVRVKERTRR